MVRYTLGSEFFGSTKGAAPLRSATAAAAQQQAMSIAPRPRMIVAVD
jgi:hypothetical protein